MRIKLSNFISVFFLFIKSHENHSLHLNSFSCKNPDVFWNIKSINDRNLFFDKMIAIEFFIGLKCDKIITQVPGLVVKMENYKILLSEVIDEKYHQVKNYNIGNFNFRRPKLFFI